jgi:hypothetical protein
VDDTLGTLQLRCRSRGDVPPSISRALGVAGREKIPSGSGKFTSSARWPARYDGDGKEDWRMERGSRPRKLHQRPRVFSLALAAALVVGAAACSSLPLDSVDPSARGTVTGAVHGPDGIDPVKGRLVEAVELESGRRVHTETNAFGEYTLLLPPGQYRIEVVLGPGEGVVKDPGVVRMRPGELVAHADVVLGGAGVVARG